MRNPSPGDDALPPHAADQARSGPQKPDPLDRDSNSGSGQTRSNVDGRTAPRLPHERDESSDSGTGAPSDVVQRGHDDAVSGKTGGDKGEATEDTYRRGLRGSTSGPQRN